MLQIRTIQREVDQEKSNQKIAAFIAMLVNEKKGYEYVKAVRYDK